MPCYIQCFLMQKRMFSYRGMYVSALGNIRFSHAKHKIQRTGYELISLDFYFISKNRVENLYNFYRYKG
jgi:hypothetical protein